MAFLPRKQQNSMWRNPFYELDRLQREMNHMFEPVFSPGGDSHASLLEGFWSPAVDVVDKKDVIVVKADLPGLQREDIDVTIENNILTIRGEKKREDEHKEGDVVRCERYSGSFQRAFTLPSIVNPEKVQAKFNEGVLELVISKKEEAKLKQVKIDVK